MYTMYWIFYHIFHISMNFYKFCNDYNVVLHYKTLFCIISTVSHSAYYFLHFLLFHISQHQPKIVYMKMWNRQVIIHKKIYIIVWHMITKMFTHINLCKVNMNYMWNYIYTCYVEWYMLTMLSSSIDTFHSCPVHSDPDVPISTQIIATVYQKFHWQYGKSKYQCI